MIRSVMLTSGSGLVAIFDGDGRNSGRIRYPGKASTNRLKRALASWEQEISIDKNGVWVFYRKPQGNGK